MDTYSLEIRRVALSSIHPDPANVRLHDERNLESIKGSLARFGLQKPIVVDGDGVIRAGNGTYHAAKALGWETIAVVETDLVGLEATAYAIADRHFKNVSLRLSKTVTEFGGTRVRDLKPMHAVRIRSEASSRGMSNRTANLIVQSLQAMLRWAVENQIIAQNPIENVKPLPYSREHHRYKRRPMTDKAITQFLAASEEEDTELDLASSLAGVQRVPQTAMWMAFLETGARWNELRLATWGDLDMKRRLLTLREENTKSRKQRVIPLTESLVGHLTDLRALQESVLGRLPNVEDRILLSPHGHPWSHETTNPRRIFHRLLKKAGIPKVNAQGEKLDIHALRTTCGSRMARNGVPLVKAQRILGHSDPKLTAVHYVGLDVEDLRDAVQGLPGSQNKDVKEAQ